MKLTIRIDSDNGIHCHFTVFVNGANAGKLCMRTEEAKEFFGALKDSYYGVGGMLEGKFLTPIITELPEVE